MGIFDEDFDTDTRTARPATGRQLDYIEDLRRDWESARSEWAKLTGTTVKPMVWGELPETMDEASDTITKAKDAVAKMRSERNAARFFQASGGLTIGQPAQPAELDLGVYMVDASDADGQLYLVRRGQQSGGLYASVWDGSEWEYLPGGMSDVIRYGRPATLDEAAEFGKATGVCARCGRLLTNPDSIERGIGPICASRF